MKIKSKTKYIFTKLKMKIKSETKHICNNKLKYMKTKQTYKKKINIKIYVNWKTHKSYLTNDRTIWKFGKYWI